MISIKRKLIGKKFIRRKYQSSDDQISQLENQKAKLEGYQMRNQNVENAINELRTNLSNLHIK